MTIRQKILSRFYPLLMRLVGRQQKARIKYNSQQKEPAQSIYSMKIKLADGGEMSLENQRGKKILFVNTASDCGYTAQFSELQALQDRFATDLNIIGLPANDFKEQEKSTDHEIATFCQKNYGIKFPIAAKSVVVKGAQQNPLFSWLSDSDKNGWNNQAPEWNFSKYLIDEQGLLTHYFPPGVSPLSDEVVHAVQRKIRHKRKG